MRRSSGTLAVSLAVVLTAALPVLDTGAAEAATVISGHSFLRADGDAASPSTSAGVDEADHDGNYAMSVSDSDTGPDGTANVAVSQTDSASGSSYSTRGSVSASASAVADANFRNELEALFTVSETGQWSWTLTASTGGSACPETVVKFGPAGGSDSFAYALVDCADTSYAGSGSVTLQEGVEYAYSGFVNDTITGQSAEVSWDLRISKGVASPAAVRNTSKPTVTGTKRVGEKVRATKGSWTGNPSAFTYQWRRGGNKIIKATKRTYTLKAKDKGKRISVKVVASHPQRGSASATSKSYLVKRAL